MNFIYAALLAFYLLPAPPSATMQLTSTDFSNGQAIPVEHSCDGAGTSEALSWSGLPEGTRSLALVLFDPDARPPRGFVHWVVYDIPPTATGIPGGKYDQANLPGGGVEGNNGRGALGFIPSCPPPADNAHHYTFTLYALSVPTLGLAPGATRDQVLAAVADKTLAQATLVGLYKRQPK